MKSRDDDSSDRPRSYGLILEAAADEVAERGRDGLNIERIAARAGVNKALVYRYFGDRNRLIDAAMEHVLAARIELVQTNPPALEDLLAVWIDRMNADKRYLQILLREALDCGISEIALEAQRRDYYRLQIEGVKRLQADGELPVHIEPEMFFLALMSMLAFPAMFPRVVSLAIGADSDSETFTRRWHETLVAMSRGGRTS